MQKGYFGSENLMVQKHTQQDVPSVGGFSIGLLGREPPSFVSAQRYFMQFLCFHCISQFKGMLITTILHLLLPFGPLTL